MRLRDLFTSPHEPRDAPPGASARHQHLIRQASALIAASDDAIARALSANSEAFLAANRQEGGQ